MWQNLWEIGQEKDITVYHVTGHVPLVTPGSDKAEMLLHVRWLEKAPACDALAPWTVVACSAKTMWTAKQQWNLSLEWKHVTDAFAKYLVCSQDMLHSRHTK